MGAVGREKEKAYGVTDKGVAHTHVYTFGQKGFFGGISLETAVLNVRSKENSRFYGKSIKAKDILWEGAVESPQGKGIEEVSDPILIRDY